MDGFGWLSCVSDYSASVQVIDMASTTLILWNHEPYYESPARKTFNVMWDGQLLRADLSVDVDPAAQGIGIGCVNRITVNGTDVNFIGDRCNIMTADLRSVLRQGSNVIEIYHNANPIPGIQSGGMYVTLTIESSGQVGGNVNPPENGDGGQANLMLVLAVLLIVVVLLVLLR